MMKSSRAEQQTIRRGSEYHDLQPDKAQAAAGMLPRRARQDSLFGGQGHTEHLVLAHERRQPLIAILDGMLLQVVHEVDVLGCVVGGKPAGSCGLQLCLHHPACNASTWG